MVPVTSTALVPRTSKNKNTAGIFALLLGGIGNYKFYLGQTGMGVVYLLFCWTMIPALIAFVEGIILLTMTDDAFAQKYPGLIELRSTLIERGEEALARAPASLRENVVDLRPGRSDTSQASLGGMTMRRARLVSSNRNNRCVGTCS